jgi:molybdopterin-guanine dinucleotide biosynthesis protein A
MPPGRESVAGVILAGGRGTRMGGVDKGWAPWQGRFLIERVLERLAPQVGQVIINANRNLDRYCSLGHLVVEDDTERYGRHAGPLAGMLAGLRHSALPWVVFVPCDVPALPADLVARLLTAVGESGTPALAVSGGRRQPVFCLMPRALIPQLDAALISGERRPTAFLDHVGAREVVFEDAAAFANINTGGSDTGAEAATTTSAAVAAVPATTPERHG